MTTTFGDVEKHCQKKQAFKKRGANMVKFKKTSQPVLDLFAEATKGLDCEPRKMFGYPCLFKNGNMFAGTFGDKVFFRVPQEDQASVRKKTPVVSGFEPLKGRVMKDYLSVDVKKTNKVFLKRIISFSWNVATRLPPKIKKPASRK
jgi:TfoX/Sxy family transcriptional regulator of competence genes